jgi:predicted DNA-binding transcriptional regulator AlpA
MSREPARDVAPNWRTGSVAGRHIATMPAGRPTRGPRTQNYPGQKGRFMRLFHRKRPRVVSGVIRRTFRASWGRSAVKRSEMAMIAKIVQASSKPIAAPERNGRLLRAEDVGEITGLSVETLAQWRSQRKGIPFVKLSRNCVRYRREDLERWLDERIVRVEHDPSNARRNN